MTDARILAGVEHCVSMGLLDPPFQYWRRSARDPREAVKMAVKVMGSTDVGTDAPDPEFLWMAAYAGENLGRGGGGDGQALPTVSTHQAYLKLV